MTLINLSKTQPTDYTSISVNKPIGPLPPSIWQNVMHFIPPKECARTIHPVCTSWKDILPIKGELDLTGLNIHGAELARIIEYHAKREPIVSLSLANCPDITDDDLAYLSKFPLQQLDLSECTKITDKGLSHLSKLPLRILSLRKCREITDSGIHSLKELPLDILDLSGCTRITDNGAAHLKKMSLKWLNLYDCFRIKDQGIKHLLLNNSIARLHFPNPEIAERLLYEAVDRDDAELVSKLLASKVPPEPTNNLTTIAPLYIATQKENLKVVELLLQAGADPHRGFKPGSKTYTPYEMAKGSKNPALASAFFTHSLPRFMVKESPASIAHTILGLNTSGRKAPKLELGRTIADGLPSLCPVSQLRALSPYVSSDFRTSVCEHLLQPLLTPQPSIQSIVTPLQDFAAKETRIDPHFAVYISPPSGQAEEDAGDYSHQDGIIHLYVRNQQIRKDGPPVLLHELSHKACDKLGWNSSEMRLKKAELESEVLKDIGALKRDGWLLCHKAVRRMLQHVEEDYAPHKRFEEYLVRMPEIMTLMAQESPKPSQAWIEKRIQKDLPRLYAIYRKEFLPQLEQYNKSKKVG